MALGIDFTYGPQEPEWEAVLVEVRDFDDALALSRMFEYRRDVLMNVTDCAGAAWCGARSSPTHKSPDTSWSTSG